MPKLAQAVEQSEVQLSNLVLEWEEQGRRDPRDQRPYRSTWDQILFHASLRFADEVHYEEDGPFVARLLKWLRNVTGEEQMKALFRLAALIEFYDRLQMRSLYRDAHRRLVTPWLFRDVLGADTMLSGAFEQTILDAYRGYALFSVTLSGGIEQYIKVNDLKGLRKPEVLGEDPARVPARLPAKDAVGGAIVVEDFVGTGGQALRVLLAMKESREAWRVLFVPLIALGTGARALSEALGPVGVDVRPVLVVGPESCIGREGAAGEPGEYPVVRSLVLQTASRVTEDTGPSDDPPTDAFGYGGLGSLIVTSHNVPNNTLPLIHHETRRWVPLFRRLHHARGGPK